MHYWIKLKNILHCNKIILLILSFTIVYVYLYCNKEVTVNNSTSEAVNTANVTVNNNSQSTKTNGATLPQTGNESSMAATALGAILAMFGLGLARNKKREY